MFNFYISLALMLATGVVGYYIGERGMAGVINDLNNVKQDIADLKAKVNVG